MLDESTALLDPSGREQVLSVARKLNAEGVTIIAVTHFMHEAVLADRVIVLENGSLALQGSPREVFNQAGRLRELQLDVPEITQLAQKLHALNADFPADVLTVDEFVDAMTRDEGRRTEDGRTTVPFAGVHPEDSSAHPAFHAPIPPSFIHDSQPVITVTFA